MACGLGESHSQTIFCFGRRSGNPHTTPRLSPLVTHTLFTDLFFTRVTPSKQFDLLAEDFDYRLVAAVVAGMVVGTVVLSWLAARKTLRTLWK